MQYCNFQIISHDLLISHLILISPIQYKLNAFLKLIYNQEKLKNKSLKLPNEHQKYKYIKNNDYMR